MAEENMWRSLCLEPPGVALTGPWTSPAGPVGSQLLWDTLILVPCEEEGEERRLGKHSL